MKPHIAYSSRAKFWFCWIPGSPGWHGCGTSPGGAYIDCVPKCFVATDRQDLRKLQKSRDIKGS